MLCKWCPRFGYGFACRIDFVAEQLGISQYEKGGNLMVDTSTIEYITVLV
ncbi:MAG: hypothetical protein CM15mV19_1460 [uncultured marine virus]|nr:MAG: hypothetical protein CM15mV19_1460 [uncultured marine virus]